MSEPVDKPKDLIDLLVMNQKPASTMPPPSVVGKTPPPRGQATFGRGGFMMPAPRTNRHAPIGRGPPPSTSLAVGRGPPPSLSPTVGRGPPPSTSPAVGRGPPPSLSPAVGRPPPPSKSSSMMMPSSVSLGKRSATTSLLPPPPPSSRGTPNRSPLEPSNAQNTIIDSSSSSVITGSSASTIAMNAPTTAGIIIDEENEEQYDPIRPNDYLAYCKERDDIKDNEERNRLNNIRIKEKERLNILQEKERDRLRIQMREEREQTEISSMAPPSMGGLNNKNVSNLELNKINPMSSPNPPVPAGRGRGRGMSNLPAWMIEQKKQQEVTNSTSTIEAPRPRGPPAAIGQYDDISPSSSSSQSSSQSSSSSASIAAAAAAKKRALFRNPTKVVLLKNMVGRGEVDADLEKEVGEECSKFGPVNSCRVFEDQSPGIPDEESVRTFVKFEKQESAIKAFLGMEGRFFAGRQITCAFFNEDRFERKEFAPRSDEMNQ